MTIEALTIGPVTQAYLDTPIDRSMMFSKTAHFHKHFIFELRQKNTHKGRYDGKPLIFTMRDTEYRGLVSLKQIYMNSTDEFDCAMKAFGSWDHWAWLCKDNWFMHGSGTLKGLWTGVADWREEKRLLEQRHAKQVLIDLASKGHFAAAKMLFENTLEKDLPGRPSKEKITERITQAIEKEHTVIDDLKRIKLAVNNDKPKKVSSPA